MNNKIKTSMILSTTVIALLAVMLAPSDAFANHTPWYGGSILPNGDAGMYFHCSTLNSLKVDGDTSNNCWKVTNEVEDSMSTYSNLGNDIDLTTTSTFTDHIVYAANLGSYTVLAEATYPSSTGDYVRYNTLMSFKTSGSCSWWSGYNLEWVANHELGHTVGLAHQNTSGENSVVVPNCASSWSTVQSHDDAVLDYKY